MTNPIKLILCILLMFLTLHSYSQKRGYLSGYIITHDGDTINGYIKDRSPEPYVALYPKIQFRNTKNRKKEKFSPNEICEYGVNGSVFRSVAYKEIQDKLNVRYIVTGNSPKHFLKLIHESETLIYYQKEYIHDDNFFLDFVPLLYKPESKEMVRATQGIFGLKKKLLSKYFADCEVLLKEINKRRKTLRTTNDIYDFYIKNCSEH